MQAKLELHDQEDQLSRITQHHHHDHVQRATIVEQHHHQQEPGQSPSEASHLLLGTQGIRYQIASLSSAAPPTVPVPVPVPNPKPAPLSKLATPAPVSKEEAASDPPRSFLPSVFPSSGLVGEPGIVATFVDSKEPPSPNHKSEENKVKIESRRSSLGPAPPSTPLSPHHCSSQQATESIPHIPHPSLSTSTPQPPNPGFTGSAAWRRRLSKTRSLTTMTASVKRSLSTPNVQQAAAMAAEGPSSTSGLPYSTGKGRNKLGYHRTSVACGHCRRRKIRCLLAKDDLHGRCSNCIRLKKECNFYPVENTDRRPRSMSKPDINSQDTGSSGSSPSPGFGPGQLSENANGYPVSVPVTPTWGADYEFGPSAFEHQFLQNSISRQGRVMVSQSASVSRRTSMAQMHTPTTVKVEPGYPDLVPRWELPSQPEPPTNFPAQAALEDPSSLSAVIWRATGGPMTGNTFPQQSISSSTPLPADSMDNFEDGIWTSQAPSRMGSIDQGMGHPFSYQSAYSSDVDLGVPPDMYSASASTASLTASISESSHYGGDHQFYSNQWAEHGAVGNGCELESMRLESDSFDQTSFADEEQHYISVEENSPFYPSPLQSTAAVSMPQI